MTQNQKNINNTLTTVKTFFKIIFTIQRSATVSCEVTQSWRLKITRQSVMKAKRGRVWHELLFVCPSEEF